MLIHTRFNIRLITDSLKIYQAQTMKFILSTVVFIFSFLITNAEEIDSDIWNLKHEKDGILIYTKKDAHHSIKDLKMTSTISGKSLSSFAAIFQDLKSYPTWVYSCNEAKVIERISDTQIIYYTSSDFPWPMSDRDFVLYNKVWQNQETGAFHSISEAHNSNLNKKSGLVRVTHFKSEWIITPADKGKFDLLYTFSADPGGQIPAWIVNTFAEFGPLNTIKQIETQAQKPKYQNTKISYINEKHSQIVQQTGRMD